MSDAMQDVWCSGTRFRGGLFQMRNVLLATVTVGLLVSGCGGVEPGRCTSACGMWTFAEEAECSEFRRQELRALVAFEDRLGASEGWTLDRTCKAVAGYRVAVHPHSDGRQWEFDGTSIAGMCNCTHRYIHVANTEWHTNSLTHEIAHAIEGCPVYRSGDDHSEWTERGVYEAIEAGRKAEAVP